MKTTYDDVTHMITLMYMPSSIFVYSTTDDGKHFTGSGNMAKQKYGAEVGRVGYRGRSYGIALLDEFFQPLPLPVIQANIAAFCEFTQKNKQFHYLVSDIDNCVSGYNPEILASYFSEYCHCKFRSSWKDIVGPEQTSVH